MCCSLQDVHAYFSVRLIHLSTDIPGNRLGTGIAIRYTVGTGVYTEVEIVKMTVEDGLSKKTAMAWIAAMQKVCCGI